MIKNALKCLNHIKINLYPERQVLLLDFNLQKIHLGSNYIKLNAWSLLHMSYFLHCFE